ncbi:subunit of a tRNA methyltransferase complex composed of Trm8p and Trm82p [Wilcoxina mikolae CBS 423.85]|nr:subunit of a tRNA methyltransferase complex composed of Trm8p and Trm82p [Wilcoxina mikolae CBS 423.85]
MSSPSASSSSPAPKRQKPTPGARTGEKAQYRTQRKGLSALPKKRFYRQRAHANPFSDHNLSYPPNPASQDWTSHFPDVPAGAKIEIADVGCGFGGLLVALATKLPDTLMLGLEIRLQVTEYVQERISALRLQRQGEFGNVSVLRTNAMKFLPNLFERGQLTKLFLCFPDPHFKARKHKARIVSPGLCAEYAYVVKPGGVVYTITDVEDLHNWMAHHFGENPLFDRMTEEELVDDVGVETMMNETEEGKKVGRNEGRKWVACFRRREDPEW